jgi:hypothetical protein
MLEGLLSRSTWDEGRPTLRATAAKVAVLLLGITLFVAGGYVASGGKGISFWWNSAPAAPEDKDELNNASFTEVAHRQHIEIPREDYYLMLFDADGGAPNTSHTFATFVKATGKGLDKEEDQLEVHTISWMPASLNIVVLRRTPEPGVNLDLSATLDWARSVGARVTMTGPYRIQKELYDRALAQEERLRTGRVQYKAIDRNFRPQASNCIHAVCDVDTENGLFHIGREWGEEATRDITDHLRRWIIDPQNSYPWLSERLGLKELQVLPAPAPIAGPDRSPQ